MRKLIRFALLALFSSTLLWLTACSDSNVVTTHDTVPAPVPYSVSYRDDIEPILEQKCLVCHGCYDAPCQLKFETPEGLVRGAHKDSVYNGARLSEQDTTRPAIDAHSAEAWRDLGFYSVLAPGG